MHKYSRIIVVSGIIVVVIAAVVFEQVMEGILLRRWFSFRITSVLLSLLIGIVLGRLTLTHVWTLNISLMNMYNYKIIMKQEPDLRVMPKTFVDPAKDYGLFGRHNSFTWKETIRCVIKEE